MSDKQSTILQENSDTNDGCSIPKVIHCCWFGGNPKPELVQKCMDSWRMHCPDWEIREWNESNFDVNQHPFMKAAYEAKKWAFVSDLARLLVVYEHGGVYLDTDVELKVSLTAQMEYSAFFAFENLLSINSGTGFGSVAKNPCVLKMIQEYDTQVFSSTKTVACPVLNTQALQAYFPDLKIDGTRTQQFGSTVIYSMDDFGKIGCHHGMQSWIDGPKWRADAVRRSKAGLAVQKWLKQPEKFAFVEKYFGLRAKRIYSFIAYDFFDCGVTFFLRRLWYRLCKKLRSGQT